MTGVTSGQTALATATDSDDVEVYSTTALVTVLQTLANLFDSVTGHDHTGSGKGKPIGSAGIASGIHLTAPVVDSGGLTVTAGGATVTAGGLTVTAGNIGIGTAAQAGATSAGITVTAITTGATNNYGIDGGIQSGGSGSNVGVRIAGGNPALYITAGGLTVAAGTTTIAGNLAHTGTSLGFYGTAVQGKGTVVGSRGGNAALGNLLTTLAAYGLITDSTTA